VCGIRAGRASLPCLGDCRRAQKGSGIFFGFQKACESEESVQESPVAWIDGRWSRVQVLVDGSKLPGARWSVDVKIFIITAPHICRGLHTRGKMAWPSSVQDCQRGGKDNNARHGHGDGRKRQMQYAAPHRCACFTLRRGRLLNGQHMGTACPLVRQTKSSALHGGHKKLHRSVSMLR
jgi:hypothetical protein